VRREEIEEDLPESRGTRPNASGALTTPSASCFSGARSGSMADKVGDEFDGYITGVAAFGLFIELVDHFVEGWCTSRAWPTTTTGSSRHAHASRREHAQGLPSGGQGRVQVVRVDLERRRSTSG
jgi:ribonuclease R